MDEGRGGALGGCLGYLHGYDGVFHNGLLQERDGRSEIVNVVLAGSEDP
jgi:hypothetical protein